MTYFLSQFQADEILAAAKAGKPSVEVSLDLGCARSRVYFDGSLALLPDGQKIGLSTVEGILGESTCFAVEKNALAKIHFFLRQTGRFYRLFASGEDTPPTAEISGVRMHQTKNMDPGADTQVKIEAIKPVFGRVLDTCTGLGYTAIEALKSGASEVYTVEVDEGMMRLCEINPWSRGLLDKRIRKIRGDVSEVLGKLDDGFFDAVIHDPPRLALAGGLYSLEFYKQLYRVLKPGGKLFHYVGSPGGKYRGKDVVGGVAQRLAEAGFTDVAKKPEALGVSAKK
jgi:predicted methyltransferase